MFAIVDIESTGGRFNEEAIMEIAIILHDGEKVVDKLVSLVNPGRGIQAYVTKLTGITEKMVRRAPRFHEIAKRVVEITEDAIVVAHNVDFDYRMLQLEFRRLGYEFERQTLDTIGLAEVLIPGLQSYGLERLCDELNILIPNRHRAEGDALATQKLFEILLEKDREKIIQRVAKKSSADEEPKHPFVHITRNLKNETGVYFLYNAAGEVIFVGRSNNLRNKINRHFLPTNAEARALQNEVSSIEVESTGSELMARIKELLALGALSPKYNRNGKPFLPFALRINAPKRRLKSIEIAQVNRRTNDPAFFHKMEEALQKAVNMCVLMGLSPAEKIVQSTPIGKDLPKAALPEGLKKNTLKSPYSALRKQMLPKEPTLLIDKGRHPQEKSFMLIENHRLIGIGYYELEKQIQSLLVVKKLMTPVIDHPYMRSLVLHFLKHNKGLKVRSFHNE